MGALKELITKVTEECQEIYSRTGGYTRVIDHVNKQLKVKNPDYAHVQYEQCDACDNHMPSLLGTCLVCGQQTQQLPIWSEVRNDYELEGIVHIDAWVNEDENAEGKTIALVDTIKKCVIFKDLRASRDTMAMEAINEILNQ